MSTEIELLQQGGGGGSVGSNCCRCRKHSGGRPVAANWVGQQRQHQGSNAKRDKERWICGERCGNSTNSWRKRDGGETREEAMQQPTSTREAQREERDGGVTREERGGMEGVARAARQKAMRHNSK